MPFLKTKFEGLQIFEPKVFEDDRGYFFESYNYKVCEQAGISPVFVQDNEAKSEYGVLRGLHYQIPPFAQAKLVRVLEGEVLDVVVDLRPDSATFGEHFSIVLNGTNKKQLYVPRGFAHGYLVLSQQAIFTYKVDNYYSKTHEGGLLFNDPKLGIDWSIPEQQLILADRDKNFPVLGAHRRPV